jgi:predicted nucleic acid-binding Zn ribbon protein
MERASRIIGGLNVFSNEQLVLSAWPKAAGKQIHAHTRPAKLVRTRLVVEVEDRVWRDQLMSLSGFMLRNLERRIGPGIVESIEFRIVPKRREPQRAMAASAGTLFDEADAIADPVLRGLYRRARERESA